MDRIKRISTTVLEKYPDRFGPDFEKNKKALQEIAVTKSKVVRNRVAGYITEYLREVKVLECVGVTGSGSGRGIGGVGAGVGGAHRDRVGWVGAALAPPRLRTSSTVVALAPRPSLPCHPEERSDEGSAPAHEP